MNALPQDPRAAFVAVLEPLDLTEAALRLALGEEPRLELDPYREELERLGAELERRLPADADLERKLQTLSGFLFAELGWLGNEQDYYDPRNSYPHEVIRRGLGIPISLSLLTVEVGRRAGLELHGVGFPAHFLVGAPGGYYLDPFHQGRLMREDDCAELLALLTGGQLPFQPTLLTPVDDRAILARMLRNLKGCHLRRGDLDMALLDVDRLIALGLDGAERRDRGLIQLARGAYDEAVDDLQRYLDVDPPDALVVRERLEEARRQAGRG
ncbi:MAG: transglutaminase family protein [Planctomycetes bacterium]|nr:transglutaminase family protein [Planctomycetota bacterium]